MAGRVARGLDDDHRTVAEDVVVVGDQAGVGCLERAIVVHRRRGAVLVVEHDRALDRVDDPGRPDEESGVARVVPMPVRDGQEADVGRRQVEGLQLVDQAGSRRGPLAQIGPGRRHARVPHQVAVRMPDQEARDRHVEGAAFVRAIVGQLACVGSRRVDPAPVEREETDPVGSRHRREHGSGWIVQQGPVLFAPDGRIARVTACLPSPERA